MTNKTKRPRRGSLALLLTKLKISFLMSLVGACGLAIVRLDQVRALDSDFLQDLRNLFYLDVGLMALIFLGLFLAFYYSLKLRPRVRRVDELGEDQW